MVRERSSPDTPSAPQNARRSSPGGRFLVQQRQINDSASFSTLIAVWQAYRLQHSAILPHIAYL